MKYILLVETYFGESYVKDSLQRGPKHSCRNRQQLLVSGWDIIFKPRKGYLDSGPNTEAATHGLLKKSSTVFHFCSIFSKSLSFKVSRAKSPHLATFCAFLRQVDLLLLTDSDIRQTRPLVRGRPPKDKTVAVKQ
jgi:hypothetical protein